MYDPSIKYRLSEWAVFIRCYVTICVCLSKLYVVQNSWFGEQSKKVQLTSFPRRVWKYQRGNQNPDIEEQMNIIKIFKNFQVSLIIINYQFEPYISELIFCRSKGHHLKKLNLRLESLVMAWYENALAFKSC